MINLYKITSDHSVPECRTDLVLATDYGDASKIAIEMNPNKRIKSIELISEYIIISKKVIDYIRSDGEEP